MFKTHKENHTFIVLPFSRQTHNHSFTWQVFPGFLAYGRHTMEPWERGVNRVLVIIEFIFWIYYMCLECYQYSNGFILFRNSKVMGFGAKLI